MTDELTVRIHERTRGTWRLRVARLAVGRRWQTRAHRWAVRGLRIEIVTSNGSVLDVLRPDLTISTPSAPLFVSSPR